MPAITKDEAIKVLRDALQKISETRFGYDGDCGVVRYADDALYATEHITDTAATQAAEKPQDGLVNPPSRAEPASQHTNTYRISFMVRCPNNDHVIRYGLSIESKDTIMVEDIVAAVDALPAEGFQEDIAAQLAAKLPGLHTIIAHHHGVDIETRRGAE